MMRGMNAKLLTPDEVDQRLRYNPGRAERLARRGLLPHIKLPDGAIRFEESAIEASLTRTSAKPAKGVSLEK